MIDRNLSQRNSVSMKHTPNRNPVSNRLLQAATVAPFVMEKQNYLKAAQEIDRLNTLIDHVHAYIHELPDHTCSSDIIAHIKHILQTHES